MVLRLFLWPLSDQTKENKKTRILMFKNSPSPLLNMMGFISLYLMRVGNRMETMREQDRQLWFLPFLHWICQGLSVVENLLSLVRKHEYFGWCN